MPCGAVGSDDSRTKEQRDADELLGIAGEVLLVGLVAGALIFGLTKTFRELKRLGSRPPRPRQPWEVGGPV